MMLKDVPDTLAPKVSVTINGAPVPVSRIDLSHGIGQLPFAVFDTQLDNASLGALGLEARGAVKLDLELFNQLNQRVQNKLLNDFRLAADTVVTVEDGSGEKITLPGHLGRPEFSLVNGEVSLRFSCVHLGSNLQAFNASIYYVDQPYLADAARSVLLPYTKPPTQATAALPDVTIYDLPASLKAIPKQPRTDSLADRLASLALDMVTRRNNRPPVPVLQSYYTGWPVHNLNRLAWPSLQSVLKASRTSTVIKDIAVVDMIEVGINELMYTLLLSSANAWEVLQRMQQEFYLQINAGWDTEVRLEHSLTLAPSEGRVIRAPVEMVRFSMSNLFELPMIQAVMHGSFINTYGLDGASTGMTGPQGEPLPPTPRAVAAAEQMGLAGPNILVGYPATLATNRAGTCYIMSPPSWLREPMLSVLMGASVAGDNAPKQNPTNRMADTTVITRGMIQDVTLQNNQRSSLLKYYAQRGFGEYYLSGTSASVSIPLTTAANLQVGRTYQVETMDQKPLFTGYLTSVNHQIQVGGENGQAHTFLSFSHVLVEKVKLLDRSAPRP